MGDVDEPSLDGVVDLLGGRPAVAEGRYGAAARQLGEQRPASRELRRQRYHAQPLPGAVEHLGVVEGLEGPQT